MYLMTAIAIGTCAWGFYRRLPVYRQGKPLDRLDRAPHRLGLCLINAFGQLRVLHCDHRPGRRDPGELRRRHRCRAFLEGHLRCRRLHRLQTLPGPLPGLGDRQAAFPDEGRAADRRGRLPVSRCQPGGSGGKGGALGLHHLPGLPGDLPREHRAGVTIQQTNKICVPPLR